MEQSEAPQEVAFIIKAASELMKGRISEATFKAILIDYTDHLAIMDDMDPGSAGVFEKSLIAGIKATSSLIERGFIKEEEYDSSVRGYSYVLFFHRQIDEDSIHEKMAATWILGRLPSVWRLRTIVRRLAYSRRDLIFEAACVGEGVTFNLSDDNSVDSLRYMFVHDQTGNLLKLLERKDLKHMIVL